MALRVTGDIDFWVRPTAENAAKVWRALLRFGAPLAEYTEADFLSPDTAFQIGVAPHRIDIITEIDGVEFEAVWSRRDFNQVENRDIPVINLVDLMTNKAATGRPQDLADLTWFQKMLAKKRRS